ncbi:histidine kinase [Microbacterium oryzae]|uniref:histidine kinase n=1 Tax=Microbacterium oryzae TaxID=743009 RepID=A0A6I6E2X9_9MICO|nr:histidine kinase [Microbacterium oryzae]QGU28259.1 two-component sensor histidine kinase [Microbacterium oryzae]
MTVDIAHPANGQSIRGVPRSGRWRRLGGEAWRLLAALTAGVLLFIVNFGLSVESGLAPDDLRTGGILLADLVLGLVAVLLIPLRRRAPVVVGTLVAVVAGFSTLAVPAALLMLVSVATRRRWQEIAVVSSGVIASSVVVEMTGATLLPSADPLSELGLFVPLLVAVLAVAIAIGISIGGRRELVASLRERAQLSRREQALRESRAREHERTRIAQEMHDALGHRLSLVAMHAAALRYRTDLTSAETRSAVDLVHDNSRCALQELREVLAVLREHPDDASSPLPTLADLDDLVAQHPDASLQVDVDTAGIPVTVSRHAFRIVQECLTNARKHAPGRRVCVALSGEVGKTLCISVSNELLEAMASTSGGGFGLIGIDERARTVGGSARAHVDGGAHIVEVELPWT